jgi:hypothetical protein
VKSSYNKISKFLAAILFGHIEKRADLGYINIKTIEDQKRMLSFIQSFAKNHYTAEFEKYDTKGEYTLILETWKLNSSFFREKYRHEIMFNPKLSVVSKNDSGDVIVSLFFWVAFLDIIRLIWNYLFTFELIVGSIIVLILGIWKGIFYLILLENKGD